MKNKLFISLFALLCLSILGITVLTTQSKQESDILVIASVEAMSLDEITVSNTGPAEEKKCFKGGHRMVCLCANTNPCTGTDCY